MEQVQLDAHDAKSGPLTSSNGFRIATSEVDICLELVSVNPFDETKIISNAITVINRDPAKALVDALCNALGYFPEDPSTKAKKTKKQAHVQQIKP